MSQKNSKAINFLRKNAYYFVFIICLAVLTVITVALLASSNNSKPVNGGNNTVVEGENNGENNNENNNDGSTDTDGGITDGEQDQENQEPVVTVVVFDMPVKDATILKEYVSAGVVYNQTLGLYSGHKAIDFAAEEGAPVLAVYDGVIESIVTSKLEGVTITIDHQNGIKTVYNSIEAVDDIGEGDAVLKGAVIGSVSTTNRKEYKDGPHLHFEVIENGEKIDPYTYLLIEEK